MKFDNVVAKAASASGIRRPDLKKAAAALFAEIKTAVDAGEKVNVPGLGVFSLRERAAGERVGKDGKVRQVAALKSVSLKARPAKATGARGERKEKKAKRRASEG